MGTHQDEGGFPQLTWDLLDEPTVKKFGQKSSWANWPNVRWTAWQFWDAQRSSLTDEASRREAAWHHLVVTAGNFKRQAPILLPPLPAVPKRQTHPSECKSFTVKVDGEPKTIYRDIPESWRHLTGISGIGVATATTVLSALWPGWHVIADRRDICAGIGLAYDEAAVEGLLKSSGYTGETVSWQRYEWFRARVLTRAKTIDVEAVAVERALYEIDLATGTHLGTSWAEYRCKLCAVLEV